MMRAHPDAARGARRAPAQGGRERNPQRAGSPARVAWPSDRASDELQEGARPEGRSEGTSRRATSVSELPRIRRCPRAPAAANASEDAAAPRPARATHAGTAGTDPGRRYRTSMDRPSLRIRARLDHQRPWAYKEWKERHASRSRGSRPSRRRCHPRRMRCIRSLPRQGVRGAVSPLRAGRCPVRRDRRAEDLRPERTLRIGGPESGPGVPGACAVRRTSLRRELRLEHRLLEHGSLHDAGVTGRKLYGQRHMHARPSHLPLGGEPAGLVGAVLGEPEVCVWARGDAPREGRHDGGEPLARLGS